MEIFQRGQTASYPVLSLKNNVLIETNYITNKYSGQNLPQLETIKILDSVSNFTLIPLSKLPICSTILGRGRPL